MLNKIIKILAITYLIAGLVLVIKIIPIYLELLSLAQGFRIG
jgi:hypothetical protein